MMMGSMGFGAVSGEELPESRPMVPQPQDITAYGLIPELVGRLPVIVGLDALDEKALVAILTQPRNALCKQYASLFRMEGVQLEFDRGALKEIARKAIARKCGARGLRAIMEETLADTMFILPDISGTVKECFVNKKTIESKRPVLRYQTRQPTASTVNHDELRY